jgi:hypothetical protein
MPSSIHLLQHAQTTVKMFFSLFYTWGKIKKRKGKGKRKKERKRKGDVKPSKLSEGR